LIVALVAAVVLVVAGMLLRNRSRAGGSRDEDEG
jgi:archaellin